MIPIHPWCAKIQEWIHIPLQMETKVQDQDSEKVQTIEENQGPARHLSVERCQTQVKSQANHCEIIGCNHGALYTQAHLWVCAPPGIAGALSRVT